MIVRTARDDGDAALHKRGRHGASVGDDLLLVGREFRLLRFEKADRLGGDGVHQRAALAAGKHR